MAKCIVSEGKTSTEAIEKGLKEIGLPRELVEIKIIEEKTGAVSTIKVDLWTEKLGLSDFWSRFFSV